jgi:glycoside/pentoside/hexuronide:cation symporter, GPH family
LEVSQKQSGFGLKNIIAYANGRIAESVLTNTIHIMALPIYSIGLGISPWLIGLAISIPRLWDGLIDPSIGHWSDNTRSVFGRRKPFMVIGLIMAALLYVLLWSPPMGLTKMATFVYFFVFSVLFYTSSAFFLVPFYALGNELTSDYYFRTKLMSYSVMFMGIAGIVTPWAYNLCFCPYFGTNEIEGVRVVGIIGGAVIIVTGFLPILACKENFAAQNQPKCHFLSSLKSSFRNKPFIILCGVVLLGLFGILLVAPMAFYVGTYYMFGGNTGQMSKLYGVLGSSWAVTTIISSPIIYRLIKHFDKKAVLAVCLIIAMVGQGIQWYTFNPAYPYLSVVSYVLSSPGVAAMFVVVFSWLADVCDVDELQSGLRREGTFSAVFNMLMKAGVAAATLGSGILIAVAGVNTEVGAVQSPEVILRLRLLFSIIPPAIISIALVLTLLYPLNAARMHEIRAELDRRKAIKDSCVDTGIV